jgi:uncharacterized protein (DUF1499 family)
MPLTGLFFSVFLIGCSGVRPVNLGIKDGHLTPCPETPNCVSSQCTDKDHFVAPLPFSSSTSEAMADLKKIIFQMKRTKIVNETDYYLAVEFTSAFWRFVDDVEFLLDDTARTIHVRSASRMGRYDLGENRKRIEMIRAAWNLRGK